MKALKTTLALFLLISPLLACAEASAKFHLTDGWNIQSAAKVSAAGETISTTAFQPADWYAATVPSTVAGTLVDDKVYPDPFFGMNLKDLSTNSAFKGPWWYRTEFELWPKKNGQVWLNFDGINYRANIWLNGKQIADTNQVVGAYRTYQFNITDAVLSGKSNVLAVETFPAGPNSLAINWVDWNPTPPDKNMGLWRDVYVTTTPGPVALHNSQVVTKPDMPALDRAHLTVSADLENRSDKAVHAILTGWIEDSGFNKNVELAPHESKHVEFSGITLEKPRLWWPVHVGPQNLYDLDLFVAANGRKSDEELIHFGVREASSELNAQGRRVFKINGRPILVRGGGWAPDMFLRPSPEREIQELRYVKDMNLNAIRFEGKTESDRFLDLCDREGIMVIAGWCCCDYWEQWKKWKDSDYDIATESFRDQIRRIRNHPSIMTFWYGSDHPPNARAESNYLAVLKELNWPNSAQSSASDFKPALTEPTGMKMKGPYQYVPPMYWYADKDLGGAFSFATEISPGPAIPPIESLRRILPKEHLWPIDDYWSYHCGGGVFKSLTIFNEALDKRLGTATSVEDYAEKAQLMAYDGERAMFEAYARNKYDSTGVIQWMMNNAWPSMIWHLYDYYLRPGGGYFGTKKACEPLHIQYSYDDQSIVVVNGFYQDFKGLKATAKIYNLDMTEKSSKEATVDIGADGVKRVFTLPDRDDLTPVYFVKLTLQDSAGKSVSDNFYWLSQWKDTLDKPQEGSDWYYTPSKDFADFTALNGLPPVTLNVSAKSARSGKEYATHVTVENPSRSLAFFVHLKVNDAKTGEEILPVIWDDNYFSLLPGEKRQITATYAALPNGAKPVLDVGGWNVKSQTAKSE